RHLGEQMEILVEGAERGRWQGRTRTNKIVFFDQEPGDEVDRNGQLVMVRVTEAGPWSMQGRLTRLVREAPGALFESIQTKKKQRVSLPLSITPTPASLTR